MLVTGRQTCCHSNLACLGSLSGSDIGSKEEDSRPSLGLVCYPAWGVGGSSSFLAESLVHRPPCCVVEQVQAEPWAISVSIT